MILKGSNLSIALGATVGKDIKKEVDNPEATVPMSAAISGGLN